MNVGMLWFDNDPRAGLEVKVARAADYYRTKYGRKPTLCFVHPSMMQQPAPAVVENTPAGGSEGSEPAPYTSNGVEVRSTRSVLPNHLWIGVSTAA